MANDTESLERLSRRDMQAIFSELSERDLKTLYTCSEIRGLTTGDVLMREGDFGQTVYVILKGELKIIKDTNGQLKEIGSLRSGDWVGEIAFSKKMPLAVSAVAGVPSSVMAISGATLNALSTEARVFFLKKLNDLANKRISQLVSSERKMNSLNRRLIDRIHFERSQGKIDYSDSEIVKKIIKKIPRLPSFASSLLIQLAGKNISLREAAELIKQDPSSVGVVLKTVNSAYYGLKQKVSDVNQALMLIGFSRIYQLIIAEGLQRTMPNTPSFNALQSHSVAISHIAFDLSLTSKTGRPSDMSTIGLLHDLGGGVILLLKKQNPSLGILIDSLDQARLGTLLLKEWGMPDILTRSLEFQSYPGLLPPDMIHKEIRNNVVILHLAHLCFNLLKGKSEHTVPNIFMEENLKLFGWEQLDLSQIVRKHLLPTFTKRIEAYPITFRKLLKEYINQGFVREPGRSRENQSEGLNERIDEFARKITDPFEKLERP